MSGVSITVDATKLEEFLVRLGNAPERVIEGFKEQAGDIAQEEMVSRAPFRRGFLSMLILINRDKKLIVTVTSTAKYTKWVVGGTGLFGPRKKRIFPVKASALRFKIGGKTVFAKSIAGMKPNPFIEEAKKATTPRVAALVQILVTEAYN